MCSERRVKVDVYEGVIRCWTSPVLTLELSLVEIRHVALMCTLDSASWLATSSSVHWPASTQNVA